jgi:hypothetical protein
VLGADGIAALAAVNDALGLDYGGVDFGRERSGRIVVFEANAAMALYPPPGEPQWAYRRGAHERANAAVRSMLVARAMRGGYTPAG